MLNIPAPFHDSSEDLASTGDEKSPKWMRRMSINPIEDNFADLFVDLSETEQQAPWEWAYGSSESLDQASVRLTEVQTPQLSSVDPRMPYTPPSLNVNNVAVNNNHIHNV